MEKTRVSWELVLFLRGITEQFPYKACKTIPLQADGALSLGEVCSRSGQPQVEASELCSSVIDLNTDQLRSKGSAGQSCWSLLGVKSSEQPAALWAGPASQPASQPVSQQPMSTCMMSQVLGFSWRLRGGLCSGGKLCGGFDPCSAGETDSSSMLYLASEQRGAQRRGGGCFVCLHGNSQCLMGQTGYLEPLAPKSLWQQGQ